MESSLTKVPLSRLSVIDTANGNAVSTISVGTSPQTVMALGTRLYVPNADSGSVSVIQTDVQYWYHDPSAADANWTTRTGNWWEDSAHTIQSASLPDSSIDVFTVGTTSPNVNLDTWVEPKSIDATASGINFTSSSTPGIVTSGGLAITGVVNFYSTGSNGGTINGLTTFYGSTHNYGLVNGNAVFYGSSQNGGVVNGDSTFNDSSANWGAVNGNSVFNGNLSENDGCFSPIFCTGTITRHYTADIVTTLDFTPYIVNGGHSPLLWIVVADNAAVNIFGAQYNASTTLSTLGTGRFITVASVPTVTASSTTLIAKTTARLNGSVVDTGGVDVSSRGFNYGISNVYGTSVVESGTTSTSTGVFFSDLADLSCATTYHYQAFAINTAGTGTSSPDETFTTDSCSASVSPVVSRGHSGSRHIYLIPTQATTTASTTSKYTFNRDLSFGSNGSDVKTLQQYLNTYGYVVSKLGAGSKGKETTFFGPATKNALIKFQKDKKIQPNSGFFGPKTRAYIKSLGL